MLSKNDWKLSSTVGSYLNPAKNTYIMINAQAQTLFYLSDWLNIQILALFPMESIKITFWIVAENLSLHLSNTNANEFETMTNGDTLSVCFVYDIGEFILE